MSEAEIALENHPCRIAPGSSVNLDAIDTGDDQLFPVGKKRGKEIMKDLLAEIDRLQEILYAEGLHKLLVVIQAMDTGGKDGTIRDVFAPMDPQGLRVVSFKHPTANELARDYLWRIHAQTPRKGECVIFNRSHYEDVVAVRVRNILPESVWSRRCRHIVEFERMLSEEGTRILKFFLHISKDEQKERLQARLDDPGKHWKFNPGDLDDRKLWPQFMEAYQDVIRETSSEHAPWFVIPADRKWHRNLAVAQILIAALKSLKLEYPTVDFDPRSIVIE